MYKMKKIYDSLVSGWWLLCGAMTVTIEVLFFARGTGLTESDRAVHALASLALLGIGACLVRALLHIIYRGIRWVRYRLRGRALQVTTIEGPLPRNIARYSNGIGALVVGWDDKPTGASITINKALLIANKTKIKTHEVERNSAARANANVVGYYDTPDGIPRYEVINGRKEYTYHRVHLVPFRYCLLEDRRVMITGTSHLNMGNRPMYGLLRNRWDELPERFIRETLKPTGSGVRPNICYYEHPTTDIERTTYFSLDDYERLADYVINSNPDKTYNYSVSCEYGKGNPIATAVIVEMWDVTGLQTHCIFRVRLLNSH